MRVLRGFQRSRKKPRSGRGFHSVRAKLMFCALIRGLQNLDSPFGKGFNFVRAKPPLRRAESRFAEPRSFPVRETDWYFLRRAKSTAKTHRGLRPSGLPGTIQSSAENNFGEASDGTSRTRFFAQDGGEKALNRCDAPALQRKDLERTSKEQPYSLWTVGYGWVRICSVGCENGWLLQKVKRFVRMGDVQFAEKAYFCGL